jgi:hypothetical protein
MLVSVAQMAAAAAANNNNKEDDDPWMAFLGTRNSWKRCASMLRYLFTNGERLNPRQIICTIATAGCGDALADECEHDHSLCSHAINVGDGISGHTPLSFALASGDDALAARFAALSSLDVLHYRHKDGKTPLSRAIPSRMVQSVNVITSRLGADGLMNRAQLVVVEEGFVVDVQRKGPSGVEIVSPLDLAKRYRDWYTTVVNVAECPDHKTAKLIVQLIESALVPPAPAAAPAAAATAK